VIRLTRTKFTVLVDGGVYDNQGIHKVMVTGQHACDRVITSDAGGGATGELSFRNTIALLLTTVEVFMSRIKKGQMVQHIYENAAGANKQIAYLSLAWDIENCIPGFLSNLEKKQIAQSVIDAHELDREWVADPTTHAAAITRHLESRTGYTSIIKPTAAEKKIARTVGTNLTALSRPQIDCLIKQAEGLTEMQVKLYCPAIINIYR
jgi:NTE family protein